MSLLIGSLLVSSVPRGRRIFTSFLFVVPHEGRAGRGTRPVVNETSGRTRHVHVAAFARLIVSVGLACAVSDAVAAGTSHDTRGRWRGRTNGSRTRWQAAVGQNTVDYVTPASKRK